MPPRASIFPDGSIPLFPLGLIVFLGFFGIDLCLILGLSAGIPDGMSLKIYDIARIVLILASCYVIFRYCRVFRHISLDGSLCCIAVFWLLYSSHYVYDAYYQPGLPTAGHSVGGLLRALGSLARMILPLGIFLVPLTDKQKSATFRWIFVPLLLFCAIVLVWQLPRILDGRVFPVGDAFTKGQTMNWSWEGLWMKSQDRTALISYLITIDTVTTLGGMLTLLTLWLWVKDKLSGRGFVLLYPVGVICMYFGSSRGPILTVALIHVLLLFVSPLPSRRNAWKILAFALLVNMAGLAFIGLNSSRYFSARFGKLVKELILFGDAAYSSFHGGRLDRGGVFEKEIDYFLRHRERDPVLYNEFTAVLPTRLRSMNPDELAAMLPDELVGYNADSLAAMHPYEMLAMMPDEFVSLLPDPPESWVFDAEGDDEDDFWLRQGIDTPTESGWKALDAIFDKLGSYRGKLYKGALHLFLSSPLAGKQTYLVISIPEKGIYNNKTHPHNSIFEVLMSTGLIGLFCFLFLAYRVGCDAIRLLRCNSDFGWVALIFLVYAIGSFFSRGCYSPLLWFTVALIQANRPLRRVEDVRAE